MWSKKERELKCKKFLKMIMGKRLYCKYVAKKHDMEFAGSYRIGQKPWMTKIHVRSCKTCGTYKKIAV